MGYFIITDSNWAKLRNAILNLAETCHKTFGEQSKHTDWLHNGNVCKLFNISKRTLQHYRDTGVLPFSQIGHKCYYKQGCGPIIGNQISEIKHKQIQEQQIRQENYGTGKRFEHEG